ncbi:MAG: hypothetical protein AABW54_03150 [Candidatus Micrarchaeota archaeon]
MRRLSELPGIDIYTDQAKFMGKTHDFIIDLQKGEVARVTLQPIESLMGMSPQWIKQNTVSYHNIVSVGDIIVVSSKPREEPEEEAPAAPQKPKYSFVPGRYR